MYIAQLVRGWLIFIALGCVLWAVVWLVENREMEPSEGVVPSEVHEGVSPAGADPDTSTQTLPIKQPEDRANPESQVEVEVVPGAGLVPGEPNDTPLQTIAEGEAKTDAAVDALPSGDGPPEPLAGNSGAAVLPQDRQDPGAQPAATADLPVPTPDTPTRPPGPSETQTGPLDPQAAFAVEATRWQPDLIEKMEPAASNTGFAPRPGSWCTPLEASLWRQSFEQARFEPNARILSWQLAGGTPLFAAVDGKVVKIHQSPVTGKTLYLEASSAAVCLLYGGLGDLAESIAEGQVLACGEPLGALAGTASAGSAPFFLQVYQMEAGRPWWQAQPVDARAALRAILPYP